MHFSNSRGQSLVEIIVASGIMMIILLAMISFQVSQQKETKALAEKLTSLELQRQLTQHLSSLSNCGLMFNSSNLKNPSDMPFDGTTVSSANPRRISLKQIPSPPPLPPVITAGAAPSPLARSLVVLPDDAIPAPGILIKVTNMTPPMGFLVINFDSSRLIHPILNLEFPLNLLISGPVNSATITGCGIQGGSSAAGTLVGPYTLSYTGTSGIYSISLGTHHHCFLTGVNPCAIDDKCSVQKDAAGVWTLDGYGNGWCAPAGITCTAMCID